MWRRDLSGFIAGCATDRGTVREKNQDRIVCYTDCIAQGQFAAACVCDGIGSYEYSEIASEIVTGGVTLWYQGVAERKLEDLTEQELAEDFCATVQELNELVWERRQRERLEIGCTMSALLAVDDHYYIYHVGDSRIYYVSDAVYQLTRDEVVVSEEYGKIKRKLANCIGRNKELWLNRQYGSILPGDTLILGSDGLFKKLDSNSMYGRVQGVSTDAQVQKLCEDWIREVESLGERDNISCGIIKRR